MKNFLIALQFLTIIPVRLKHIDENKIAGSIVYFPLVGLLLGFILTGADAFLSFLGFEQLFINIILIIFLIILTGGMHMDGLADTIDAFSSRKDRIEMLRIMRDSRIGAMGVLSLVSVILLKISFLSSINLSLKPASLLLMCVLARWALVLSLFLFPYARQEGKAKAFIEGVNLKIFIFATLFTLCFAAAICKIYGLLLLAAIAGSVFMIGRFTTAKIGGITGDTLGAASEFTEIAVLLGVCILEKAGIWII